MTYAFKLTLAADSKEEASKLATLLQQSVGVLDKRDMIRLLEKVVKNPSIVKTALKFI